jgi:hypothetical protein
LQIEREWAKVPGWFATLDRETQATLIAELQTREAGGHAKTKSPALDRRRK